MDKLVVTGGRRLRGTVRVAGGKNSSLAVLAAAALAADVSTLENVPHCRDVLTLIEILEALGARITFRGGRLTIDARTLTTHVAPYELCRSMRASFYVAGVLLGRLARAQVPLPGGCSIGARPVDFHMRGFAALGARVTTEHGYMKATARRLKGTAFYVPRSSVGTTINLMMAASTARGTTVLQNAAREPEVVDTAVFLNLMGARIKGAGTHAITIEGVKALHGATYSIIPDRLEAGTYLLAGAATGGDVLVEGMIPEHVTALLTKLEEAGVEVMVTAEGVRVRAGGELRPVDAAGRLLPIDPIARSLDLPILAVPSPADAAGVLRDPGARALLADFERVRRAEPALAARVSEIAPGPGGSLRLLLADPPTVEVLVPAGPGALALRQVRLVLADLAARGELAAVRRVDGRFRDQVVVAWTSQPSR